VLKRRYIVIGSRQKELLKTIVEEYVKTARPVGSKALCKKFKCSSATIRNDMAMLEELNYLEKTHISSGRIPSEEGYRYYVDNLMEPKKISGEDMLKLQTIFNNKELELNDAISKSLEMISDITNYTSVILGKEASDNLLQKVEVIPVSGRQLVALLITNTGHVENKNIKLEENIPAEEISKTTELLNKMLIGTPVDEVPSKLEFEVKPIIRNYIQNYEIVYNAFYNALSNFTNERDVRFTGKTNILKQPEFSTVDDVKNIISKFESKDMVSKIEETGDEVKVYIGSESEIDDNVTVIKTKYKAQGREGTIAIIGPKRMEYERVVNMLEYLKDSIENKGKEN
jgi:heat-inducible transcriptional repressor